MTEEEQVTVVAEERPKWASVLIYTLLRLAMFAIVWAVFQFFTPWNGLMAVVLAIFISGAVSLFVLNRQRDAMSYSVFNVFKRMNDRIDAATRAEDVDDEPAPTPSAEGDPQPKQ